MPVKLRYLPPVIATVLGLAIPAPIVWSQRFDLNLLAIFLLVPLGIGMEGFWLLYIFFGPPHGRCSAGVALACLPAAAPAMFSLGFLQPAERIDWLLNAKTYKHEVLTTVASPSELKHAEWAESGFAGINFFKDVVLDPSDSIGETFRRSKDGRVPGIPRPILGCLRLESGWYLVTTELPW